ncbi:MAG TPA: hypothetical protein VL132_01240, partial [Planctomycetaceae bacterium]|nr:hypothetical protein [Planctomycetaceae bacterium]
LRLWTADGEPAGSMQANSQGLKSVVYSPDGRWLATGGLDGVVRLWHPADGRQLLAEPAHRNTVFCVAFSPDGSRLATASFDRTIAVWDVATA